MTLSSYTSDIIIFLIGCLIFLFFLPYFVKAQIVINEVYPQPLSSENEWIEIYYPNYCSSQQSCNQTTISLDQWTLWDQLSTPSKIYTFLSHEEISLGQYLIINSNQKLNNSADGVMLKNSSGEIIDQMNYQNSQSACSFARYPNGLGDFFCSLPSQGQSNLAFLCSGEIINLSPNPSISLSPMPSLNISSLPLTITQTPFPSPNLTISPTPTSINYQLSPQLSEIMACPTEGSEWVEFYNPYNQTIKLEAWTLWDNQKKIYSFNYSQSIGAKQYLSIDLSNKLNNSGDDVILVNPLETEMAKFSYNSCTSGQSFIFYNNEWENTTTITKNTQNIFTSDQADQEITEDDSKEEAEDNSSGLNTEKQDELNSMINQSKNQNISNQQQALPPITYSFSLADLNKRLQQNKNQLAALTNSNVHTFYPETPDYRRAILCLMLGGLCFSSSTGYYLFILYKNSQSNAAGL